MKKEKRRLSTLKNWFKTKLKFILAHDYNIPYHFFSFMNFLHHLLLKVRWWQYSKYVCVVNYNCIFIYLDTFYPILQNRPYWFRFWWNAQTWMHYKKQINNFFFFIISLVKSCTKRHINFRLYKYVFVWNTMAQAKIMWINKILTFVIKNKLHLPCYYLFKYMFKNKLFILF